MAAQGKRHRRRNAPPIERRIARHLAEIRRLRFGYSCGGPSPKWCTGSRKGRILLPLDPKDTGSHTRRFAGCRKYGKCELIPDSVKWKRLDQLTLEEVDHLRQCRCYRATKRGFDWDESALQSRQNAGDEGKWIGNPFGIRTDAIGRIAQKLKDDDYRVHRDLAPCPIGGCVTPEMERDYRWHTNKQNGSGEHTRTGTDWAKAKVCPFFFRHTDPEMTVAVRNPQRFVQCYVTLPPFRAILEHEGLVVAAPIFRSTRGTEMMGASYWYPFYSGFSFVQMPSRAPMSDSKDGGWSDPTLPFRWQITTLTRQQLRPVSQEPPIRRLFEGIDSGEMLTSWEHYGRIVSISEGQASTFLLQWVLLRRLIAAMARPNSNGSVDLTRELCWQYDTCGSAFSEKLRHLSSLGYQFDKLDRCFQMREDGCFRTATLEQDLRLLGLLNERKMIQPSCRVSCCLSWLRAWLGERSDALGLGKALAAWAGPALSDLRQLPRGGPSSAQLAGLCLALIRCAVGDAVRGPPPSDATWDDLKAVPITGSADSIAERIDVFLADKGEFNAICRLVPAMHILVRAHWTAPLRWVFVPMAQDRVVADEVHAYSALIMMIEDSTSSLAYSAEGKMTEREDEVLSRLNRLIPLVTAVASIEEQLVREQVALAEYWRGFHDNISRPIYHLTNDIKQMLEGMTAPTPAATILGAYLDMLSQLFLPSRGPTGAEGRPAEVVIDVAAAAEGAVQVFGIWPRGRQVTLDVRPKNASALLRPIQGAYGPQDDMTQRTTTALQLLVLALLVGRDEPGIAVAVAERGHGVDRLVGIEVRVPSKFNVQIPPDGWLSPPRPIEDWPVGRGFHSVLDMSHSLGSVLKEITNTNDGGRICIWFRGGTLQ